MKLANIIEDAFTSGLEQVGLAWWIQIVTTNPKCTYYFGPFMSAKEAEMARSGYVEDLEAEAAEGISVQIYQCQPKELTIF